MSFISHMNFRTAIAAQAAVLVALGSAGAREFRVADTQAEDYPTVLALQFMARVVEERTAGRHRIRVFHSRQLGKRRTPSSRPRRRHRPNRTNVAPIGSLIPAANVLALPFLFRSFNHLHTVLDQAIGQEIRRFPASWFHRSDLLRFGSRSIYNSVRPVRSLADLRGCAFEFSNRADVRHDQGARRRAGRTPYGQVLTASRPADRRRGEQLAVLCHRSHYKLAPYYTLTEHTMGPEVLVMSLRAWESLSPEDREIFRDAARKSSMFMRELWSGLEERSRQQARAAGNTIIAAFDRKPFETAMGTIYAKTVTDPDLRQLIERIRQVQ
jgi:TRAP-type C4-dicarboxylate transport system substrate-binding protein